ncbi:MAG: UDP-N-acetylmuramoyl-L-alanine--D-glutamate ligase [Oscillospiraceae bacterium]|jgi:UDP-N-acetylmuramoylalanine--D-glutamate ligase|nr:UDP-N-acetylmuramoyl-L-alanine--D-glutamate ligase [Oscillospiraceae bacterium]
MENNKVEIREFISILGQSKIAFIGVGVSHTAAIKMFARNGAQVQALDKRELDESLRREFEALGVVCRSGNDYLGKLDADIYFRTPGLPFDSEIIREIRRNGKIVTSELEVFFKLCRGKIIGVTGSDGKTTTTTLIYKLLQQMGKEVYIGGNIGLPLLSRVEEIHRGSFVVVELSSFQLESMCVSPDIAVVTNISENHLNVHGSMENYINAKKNVFLHQDGFSRVVLNANCIYAPEFERAARGQVTFFGGDAAVCCEDGVLFVDGKSVLKTQEFRLKGAHNLQNLMAAVAATKEWVTPEAICSVATSFPGVEHRIEFCGKINDADCFNDSVATTPGRTMACIRAFTCPVVLIVGGSSKGLDYQELGDVIAQQVKCLIVTGATGPIIKKATEGSRYFDSTVIFEAKDLECAVGYASKKCLQSGDVLLFSPASASFDRYKNFVERGEHFKRIVSELNKKNGEWGV